MPSPASLARVDRRMFVAASAAFLGGLTPLAGVVACGASEEPAPAEGALPWPQHTDTTPFVHAADFGLKPCLPDRLKLEDFANNPDATDALQRALDAGAGGRVFVPPGAYRVTRPLTLKSGTRFTGAGFCSTMLLTEKAIPAILHARVTGPMTVISDLWVSGPVGGNWNTAGIWLEGSNGITIHDCWVGALGTGIRIDGISDIWLRNITFELNQHGIHAACATLGATAGNLRLLNCYGYQNYQGGITLEHCRGVQVDACGATGCNYAVLAKGCAQLTLNGSPWHQFGVRLEDCQHVTVTGCVVEGMRDYGLALAGCKHFTATGNVVRHTTAGPALRVERCELGALAANSLCESAQDGMTVSLSRRLSLLGNVVATSGQVPDSSTAWRGLRMAEDCVDCQETANIVAD